MNALESRRITSLEQQLERLDESAQTLPQDLLATPPLSGLGSREVSVDPAHFPDAVRPDPAEVIALYRNCPRVKAQSDEPDAEDGAEQAEEQGAEAAGDDGRTLVDEGEREEG